MKRFLFLLLSLPITVFAQGGLPNQPYIYVQGRAEIKKPADLVTLRFDVVTRNADEAKANQDVQTKAGKVLTLFNDRKIAQNDVIATDLRSEPQYERDEDSPRKRGKVIGYSVTRSFSVKVRDVAAFPKLIDELFAIGGVEFSSIDSGLAEEKQMQDQVWEKALRDARDQAEKTLNVIGMKIDSVFAVSPVSFPEIQREIFGSTAGPQAEAERVTKAPQEGGYRLAPITISQSVHVIYLISPAK